MKRRGLLLLLCGVLCVLLTACGETTVENMGYDTIYHTELGHFISLGMEKDEIDALLGEGVKNYYYDYPDGLGVEYEDGKAVKLRIEGDLTPWIIKGGLVPGLIVRDVWAAYGEQEIFVPDLGDIETDMTLLSYPFDKSGKLTDSVLDADVTVNFHLNSSREVTSISISA